MKIIRCNVFYSYQLLFSIFILVVGDIVCFPDGTIDLLLLTQQVCRLKGKVPCNVKLGLIKNT